MFLVSVLALAVTEYLLSEVRRNLEGDCRDGLVRQAIRYLDDQENQNPEDDSLDVPVAPAIRYLDDQENQNPEDDYQGVRLPDDHTLDRLAVQAAPAPDQDALVDQRSGATGVHLHRHRSQDQWGDLDEEDRATDGPVRVHLREDLGLGAPQESEVNVARRRVSKIQL